MRGFRKQAANEELFLDWNTTTKDRKKTAFSPKGEEND